MQLQLQPHVAFLIHRVTNWDDQSGQVGPPSSAPPQCSQLRGYALHGTPNCPGIGKDLSKIRERVIVVDQSITMRELGLMPSLEDKKEKKGNGTSHIGIYHPTPTGHYVLYLPWADKDKRRQRSETWRRYWTHKVAAASGFARGDVKPFVWGKLLTGDSAEIEAALRDMLATPCAVAVDLETVGDMPEMGITAVGLATDTVSVSVPWAGYTSKVFGKQAGLRNPRIRELIAEILASPAHAKVFHNGGFDRAVLASLGMACNGEFEDTILLMKIMFPELYRNLQFSAGLAAHFDPWKDNFHDERKRLLADPAARAVIKAQKLKKVASDWNEIPLQALLTYNAKDAAATIVLFRWLQARMQTVHRFQEKYDKLRGLAEMAAEQWLHGQAVDQAARDDMVKKGRSEVAALVWKWRKLVGPRVPPYGKGSDAKLRVLFFEKYKAPVMAYSENTGEPSLNTYSLTCWDVNGRQPLSDVAFTLFRIRKLQKNLRAFLDPLKGKDRIYAKPNVTGTLGTRCSYSEPNLQQFAKDQKATRFLTGEKFKLAPNVRRLIVAEPGCVLIEADYKALELMAVAYRTANLMWFEWMREGRDMHVMHVGLMYGEWLHRKNCTAHGCDGGAHYCSSTEAEADWVDPNGLRQITKVTTYARFYNRKGNPKPVVRMLISKMPTLTDDIVTDVFERFDTAVPPIVNWHSAAGRTDRQNGYIETGLGGWRLPVGDPPDENRNRSFEIQSTVGDAVSVAMLKLRPHLDATRQQRMLIQVHDAFIVQCREADVIEVGRAMKTCMEWVIPELWGFQNVVFPVDIKYGKNWADMSPLHLP